MPSWRLKVHKHFSDICGDVVVRRADGFVAYHLATVIDELSLGISEVVRGEDLVDSVPPQMAVTKALGERPLRYKHLPLMRSSDGKKLSKRFGGEGLLTLQSRGLNPSQVIGMLAASLGIVVEGSELSADELVRHLKQNQEIFYGLFNDEESQIC